MDFLFTYMDMIEDLKFIIYQIYLDVNITGDRGGGRVRDGGKASAKLKGCSGSNQTLQYQLMFKQSYKSRQTKF